MKVGSQAQAVVVARNYLCKALNETEEGQLYARSSVDVLLSWPRASSPNAQAAKVCWRCISHG